SRHEVERLHRGACGRARVSLQVTADDVHHPLAQWGDGSEFANVNGRKVLREFYFIAGRKGPMREIIRKAFGNVMVFFQGLKRVLEDRGVWAGADIGLQLLKVGGFFPPNAVQMRSGIEVERS